MVLVITFSYFSRVNNSRLTLHHITYSHARSLTSKTLKKHHSIMIFFLKTACFGVFWVTQNTPKHAVLRKKSIFFSVEGLWFLARPHPLWGRGYPCPSPTPRSLAPWFFWQPTFCKQPLKTAAMMTTQHAQCLKCQRAGAGFMGGLSDEAWKANSGDEVLGGAARTLPPSWRSAGTW